MVIQNYDRPGTDNTNIIHCYKKLFSTIENNIVHDFFSAQWLYEYIGMHYWRKIKYYNPSICYSSQIMQLKWHK